MNRNMKMDMDLVHITRVADIHNPLAYADRLLTSQSGSSDEHVYLT